MNENLKRFITLSCVVVDPIAVLDYKRWRRRKNCEHDELMKEQQESLESNNWPPPVAFKN